MKAKDKTKYFQARIGRSIHPPNEKPQQKQANRNLMPTDEVGNLFSTVIPIGWNLEFAILCSCSKQQNHSLSIYLILIILVLNMHTKTAISTFSILHNNKICTNVFSLRSRCTSYRPGILSLTMFICIMST